MSNDPKDNDRPCDSAPPGTTVDWHGQPATKGDDGWWHGKDDDGHWTSPGVSDRAVERTQQSDEGRPEGSAFNEDFWTAVDRER